jgi:hypothetical protein
MSDLRLTCREPGCGRPVTARGQKFCSHRHRQAAYRLAHPTPCPATQQPCVNGCRRRCADLTADQLAAYEASAP